MTKRAPFPVFTEDELRTILQEAGTVWNEIGPDCLQGLADHGFKKPRDVESVTMSRRDVIDVVIDANRLEERLKGELREKWKTLDYPQMKRLVRAAFPHGRYGL